MNKQLELTSHNQNGIGNRTYTVKKDYEFNGYLLKKGLTSDGGSIPKIYIMATFLSLNVMYTFHWLTILILFALVIDESSGWFQKPFFAHDSRWGNALSWKDIFKANWLFYKDMVYKINSYRTNYGEYYFKEIFHRIFGYLLAIVYPLTVSTLGLPVAAYKLYKKKK